MTEFLIEYKTNGVAFLRVEAENQDAAATLAHDLLYSNFSGTTYPELDEWDIEGVLDVRQWNAR